MIDILTSRTRAEGESRYFMSIEEQDAVIGRLIREKKVAERKRVALEAEAHRIAASLQVVANALNKKLAGFQLAGESLDAEFLEHQVWFTRLELDEVQKIIPLADEYREALKTISRTSKGLKEAGIE